jgi:hypothetical protein
MKKNGKKDVPVLFFNSGEEDRQTYHFVRDSKIQCEFRAAAEEPTPLLLVGYQKFFGIAEITEFVSENLRSGNSQMV